MIAEIFVQILAFMVAVYAIKEGYKANKKAKPLSLKTLTTFDEETNKEVGYARGLLGGVAIIGFLLIKLFTCGLVCWV